MSFQFISQNRGRGFLISGARLLGLALLLFGIASAALLPERAFAAAVFSASLNASSPTMTNRVYRDAVPSTCDAVKSYPADNGAGTFRYRTASFTNIGPDGCYTFTRTGGTCTEANSFLSIYNGAVFDPTNRATNYLGDQGSGNDSAAVQLTKGQTITLLVNDVASNASADCTAIYSVDSASLDFVFSGNLDGTSPTTMGRISRNGTPSGCGSVKTYPGDLNSGTAYEYATATYTNPGADGCVTFQLTGGTCAVNSFVSVYSAFNPGDRSANYLGDTGASGPGAYGSVFVTAGQSVTLFVEATTQAANCSFIVNARKLAPQDFDASGMSDVLWRNSSGSLGVWFMNGTHASLKALPGSIDPAWQIVGTSGLVRSVGDFDGDGQADFLGRKSNGALAMWLMNGAAIRSMVQMGGNSPAWQVAGVADFDSDGKSDILWRNTNGSVGVWLMNGSTIKASAVLATVLPSAWQIVGLGDFTHDGKADILWRHTGGGLRLWVMDGTTLSSDSSLGSVSTAWQVAGVDDFDADGFADILWRRTDGSIAIWLMYAPTLKANLSAGSAANAWQIVSTGDYDNDGAADILWRHSNGSAAVWLMTGAATKSAAGIGNVPVAWTIVE